jgi:Spy/CpxP family protein refolding chaperone
MGKTWQVVIAFTGIFAAGAVSGGFIASRWLVKAPAAASSQAVPQAKAQAQTMEQFVRSQTQSIGKRINLTPQQIEQIKPATAQALEDLKHLRRETVKQTIEALDRLNREVDRVLTAEQRDKFDEIRLRQRERIRSLLSTPTAPRKDKDGKLPKEKESERSTPAPKS